MLSHQLQPIAIEDCLPFFQELHSNMKDAYTDAFKEENKVWTDISHCLRLSYTESLMENNKFAFIVLRDGEANIVAIDLEEQGAKRLAVPSPPRELAANFEFIQEMFSMLLAIEMQSVVDDGFIFGPTQKRLTELLA